MPRWRTIIVGLVFLVLAGAVGLIALGPAHGSSPPTPPALPNLVGPIPYVDGSPEVRAELVNLMRQSGYTAITCTTRQHQVNCDATSPDGLPTNLGFEFGHHRAVGWTQSE